MPNRLRTERAVGLRGRTRGIIRGGVSFPAAWPWSVRVAGRAVAQCRGDRPDSGSRQGGAIGLVPLARMMLDGGVGRLRTMSRIKRILVPTDFSPTAEIALQYATDLAPAGALIHVIHVVDDTGLLASYPTACTSTRRHCVPTLSRKRRRT